MDLQYSFHIELSRRLLNNLGYAPKVAHNAAYNSLFLYTMHPAMQFGPKAA